MSIIYVNPNKVLESIGGTGGSGKCGRVFEMVLLLLRFCGKDSIIDDWIVLLMLHNPNQLGLKWTHMYTKKKKSKLHANKNQ